MATEALSTLLHSLRENLSDEGQGALSQKEFAERIPGQPSPSTISRVEKGKMRPTDDLLKRIADAYQKHVTLQDLVRARNDQFGSKDRRGRKRKASAERVERKPKSHKITETSNVEATAVEARSEAATAQAPEAHSAEAASSMPSPPPRGSSLLNRRYTPPSIGAPPASSASAGASASAEPSRTQEAERGVIPFPSTRTLAGKRTLLEDSLPNVRAFVRGMGREEAVLYIMGATLVVDRFQQLIPASGRSGIQTLDVRAMTLTVLAELRNLLTEGAPASTGEAEGEMRNLEALLRLVPGRWSVYEETSEQLLSLFSLPHDSAHALNLRLALLRGLALGAQRG